MIFKKVTSLVVIALGVALAITLPLLVLPASLLVLIGGLLLLSLKEAPLVDMTSTEAALEKLSEDLSQCQLSIDEMNAQLDTVSLAISTLQQGMAYVVPVTAKTDEWYKKHGL